MSNPWEDDGPWNDEPVARPKNVITDVLAPIAATMPAQTPKRNLPNRTLGEVANDAGISLRSGANSVVGGLLGAPINIANLVTQRGIPSLINALSPALGTLLDSGQPAARVLGEVTAPAIVRQPDAVQGMREGLREDTRVDQLGYTPQAQAFRETMKQADGFVPTLKALAQNPVEAATILGAEQVPQFVLGVVPGSAKASIGLQGIEAGGQSEEQVGEALRMKGATADEIARAGSDSFGASALVNTAAAKLIPGGDFIENAMAGQLQRYGAARAAKAVAGETLSGAAEEGGDQYQQNYFSKDPLMQGVGSAAAIGGIMEGGMAGPTALGHVIDGNIAARDNQAPLPRAEPVLGDVSVAPDGTPAVDLVGGRVAPTPAPTAPTAPNDAKPWEDSAVAPESSSDLDALLAPIVDMAQKDPEAVVELAKSVLGDTDVAPAPEPVAPSQPDTPAIEPVAGQQTAAPDADKQNRDRSRIASREQMQDIRRNPDAARLGFSRDSNTGAPLINQGADVAPADMGRSDIIILPDGRKVPVQYAVVESDAAQASHDADGNVNPAYNNAPMQALNNGRTAGIQAAWRSGNGEAYRQGLIDDAAMHGVPADAIAGKKNPMLVRLVDPAEKLTGAESNASQQLGLSPTEQAKTDASHLPDLSGLTWNDDGNISQFGNANFFRGWFGKMGATGAANMLDAQGRPNAEALRRVKGALMYRAYGDDRLLSALVEDTDDESRNITNALARAAAPFSALEDSHPLTKDIREAVTGGMQLYRDAKARGLSMNDFIGQGDLLGRDANADRVAMFYAENARSANRMAEGLRAMADAVADEQAHSQTMDVFGGRPEATTGDILDRANIGAANETVLESIESTTDGQANRGGRPGGQQDSILGAKAQASVREEPAGLFGKPQGSDYLDAARRAKDAKRDGKDSTGRTDMLSGDGELFAGDRPEQSQMPSPTVESSRDMFASYGRDTNKQAGDGRKDDNPQPDTAGRGDAGRAGLRPDANPELTRRGKYEVDALVRRFGGSVLADRIVRDFRESETAQLIGQKISDKGGEHAAKDLAAIASIYRNPLFETLRYIFTDDAGNIVGESAVSARLPSSASAFPIESYGGTGLSVINWFNDIKPAAVACDVTKLVVIQDNVPGEL